MKQTRGKRLKVKGKRFYVKANKRRNLCYLRIHKLKKNI
ncbi:hypothetical protein D1BOALGB6SA_4819 [Olavius sp. associated proteobacterium Delta 1]|nr:hypothetical protein D1BOALGB6SA_4819 [Olavius sp. associated proteobacterium Delta 1]